LAFLIAHLGQQHAVAGDWWIDGETRYLGFIRYGCDVGYLISRTTASHVQFLGSDPCAPVALLMPIRSS
jgi:hypothetical protein